MTWDRTRSGSGETVTDPILQKAGYQEDESPFFQMGTWTVIARLLILSLAFHIVRSAISLAQEVVILMDLLNGGGVG